MSDIKKDIEMGVKLLKRECQLRGKSNEYGYPFERTNEDIDTYFSEFPIKNGIITTVAGSGDQQLQIAKDAPKEIHVFDNNPFAIYMAKLKTAACLTLSYEKFKSFFTRFGFDYLDINDYKVIRECLDEECRMFWDAMYEMGDLKNNFGRLIQPGDNQANRGLNSYEREENFYKTKSNLEKTLIYYYYSEFYSFFNELVNDKKFDAIFLSNIFDWLPIELQKSFAEYIKTTLVPLLNKDGMIAVYSPVRGCYRETGLESDFTESFQMNYSDKVLVYKK